MPSPLPVPSSCRSTTARATRCSGSLPRADIAEAVLAEQIRYYEARSEEYLEWIHLENRYEAGPDFTRRWEDDLATIREAIVSWAPDGDIVEIAAGPGTWTGLLADLSAHVTALDASPSMLRRNRTATRAANVDFVLADVFTWQPDRVFDAAFFGFWISHVPSTHWPRFWGLMARAVRPGGSVFFLDNAHPDHARRDGGPGDWPEATLTNPRRAPASDPADERHRRRLNDGSEWTIIKRWWRPPDLEAALAAVGWKAEVHETDFAFVWGTASARYLERLHHITQPPITR